MEMTIRKKYFRDFGWACLLAIVIAACGGGDSGNNDNGGGIPKSSGKVPDTGQIAKFSTAFGDDSDYTINAPSYTDNGDGTITDNVTKLVWQKQDDGMTRTWNSANTYCTYLNLAGKTGWRLPKRMELVSIVNYGTAYPSINTSYFPSAASSHYWTSAVRGTALTGAEAMLFELGSTDTLNKTNYAYVRCVLGTDAIAGSYTDNGNGTVTDNVTKLMWQQMDNGATTWEGAITLCGMLDRAGYTDWRLPNIKELWSLAADETRSEPAMAPVFGNLYIWGLWSSTTTSPFTAYAWVMNLAYDGSAGPGANKNEPFQYHTICVRGQ